MTFHENFQFGFQNYAGCTDGDLTQIDPSLRAATGSGMQPMLIPGKVTPAMAAANAGVNLWQQRAQLLEGEMIKMRIERDTLQQLYTQLLSSQVSGGTTAKTEDRPTRETYPKIRFWQKQDFDKWLQSADAVSQPTVERGPIPWLEQEDGEAVSVEECIAIKRNMRLGFAELVAKGWAPRSWGVLCASGRELFDTHMQKYHPIFKLDLDGWKLRHLATTTYPQWRKQHLDDNMGWKKKIKTEPNDNDSGDAIGGKRKCADGNKKHGKRIKVENVGNLANSSKSPSPSSNLNANLDANTPGPAGPTPSASQGLDSELDLEVQVPKNTILSKRQSDPESPPGPTVTIQVGINETPSTPTSEFDSMGDSPGVPYINPLSENVLESAGIQIPRFPSPTLPGPAATIDVPEESTVVSGSTKTTSAATDAKTKKTKKYVWKPGTAKNGRNLCGIRWVKQIANGVVSATEFKEYYDQLSEETKKLYEEEAVALVSNGEWKTNSTAAVRDGPIHSS